MRGIGSILDVERGRKPRVQFPNISKLGRQLLIPGRLSQDLNDGVALLLGEEPSVQISGMTRIKRSHALSLPINHLILEHGRLTVNEFGGDSGGDIPGEQE